MNARDQPYTYADEIRRLDAIHDGLLQAHGELLVAVKGLLMKQFSDAGGCERCGGRGWVVAGNWSDSEFIYDKRVNYLDCDDPKCTQESRKKSGLAPYYSMFDKVKRVKNPITESDVFKAVMGPLDESLENMAGAIQELKYQQNIYTRGDEVVIIGGENPQVGTTWKISKVHLNGGLFLNRKDHCDDVDGIWVRRDYVAKLYK